MEGSWEDWYLHSEFDVIDEDDNEFLREILGQQPPPPAFSSESESNFQKFSGHIPNDTVSTAAVNDSVVLVSSEQANLAKSNNSSTNSTASQNQQGCNSKTTRRLGSPKTYILSFDKSTVIAAAATTEPCVDYGEIVSGCSKRKRRGSENGGEKKKPAAKKGRSGSQTTGHIIAERKRRQELTERFIALSATIPGLSKTDKASVLGAAIDYVKHLQERVQELEKQDKENVASVMKKPDLCGVNNNEETTTSNETSFDDDYCNNINILDLGKEVLIEIQCEKEIGIELKLLNHVENLHLFVTGTSVLPFGNSALSITMIAEVSEEYKLTVNELVKSIRQVLLKSQMASGK